MLGIIGAMNEEVELLIADLQDHRSQTQAGVTLHFGVLDGHGVIITEGGIGKVNAAMTTAALIAAGASRVIFTGVAGGVHPELAVGDLVVSTDCVQHDVDVSVLGYELGVIPGEALSWSADEQLRTVALDAAREQEGVRVMEGRVASGDQFVASTERVAWLWQTFGAVCTEMEGAAVAQVCARHAIPFVVIRSVSDTASHDANVDYREFMPQMARRAKVVVRAMLRRLEQDQRVDTPDDA
jgi:adenosylhomocysteine nucleosidase